MLERREEMDEAWSCYDHVQHLQPHLSPRDAFLERITGRMLGHEENHGRLHRWKSGALFTANACTHQANFKKAKLK